MPERELQATDVDLWFAVPDRIAGPALLLAEGLLSPAEIERYRSFTREARRREYLVTRALARTVLSRYLGVPPARLRFTVGARGRPELDPPGDLRFNLANTPGLVACAVARQDIGVDLEPHARGETVQRLERAFSAGERRALSVEPPARRGLHALSLWTLKEAYAKARGLGLTLPLDQVAFELDPTGRIRLALGPSIADEARGWRFRLLDHEDHRVALAFREAGRLRCFEIPLAGDAPLATGAEAPGA